MIGNFVVYEDRLETNLLQLFAHPENSEWFSIIYAICLGQRCCCAKTSIIGYDFFFFKDSIALNSFIAPLLHRCPASLVVTLEICNAG